MEGGRGGVYSALLTANVMVSSEVGRDAMEELQVVGVERVDGGTSADPAIPAPHGQVPPADVRLADVSTGGVDDVDIRAVRRQSADSASVTSEHRAVCNDDDGNDVAVRRTEWRGEPSGVNAGVQVSDRMGGSRRSTNWEPGKNIATVVTTAAAAAESSSPNSAAAMAINEALPASLPVDVTISLPEEYPDVDTQQGVHEDEEALMVTAELPDTSAGGEAVTAAAAIMRARVRALAHLSAALNRLTSATSDASAAAAAMFQDDGRAARLKAVLGRMTHMLRPLHAHTMAVAGAGEGVVAGGTAAEGGARAGGAGAGAGAIQGMTSAGTAAVTPSEAETAAGATGYGALPDNWSVSFAA